MSLSFLLKRLLIAACVALLLSSLGYAQVANVNDVTSTPIPGAGHDYIHLLSETVNPANGSVSLRIQLPMAKGRGIQVPFYVGYDSNSVSFLGSAQQSVRVRILRGFLESDEFGLSGSQSLRLQQQIVHVSITAAAK